MYDFLSLPINDERYLGFEGYKNLMVAYNEYILTDPQYRPAEAARYVSEYAKRTATLDAYKAQMPELLIYESQ